VQLGVALMLLVEAQLQGGVLGAQTGNGIGKRDARFALRAFERLT